MTPSTRLGQRGSRRGIGAFLVVSACVLACTLPVIGGLAAGTVLDRVLDAPAWLAVLVAIAATIAIAAARRRGKGCSDGGGSDGC